MNRLKRCVNKTNQAIIRKSLKKTYVQISSKLVSTISDSGGRQALSLHRIQTQHNIQVTKFYTTLFSGGLNSAQSIINLAQFTFGTSPHVQRTQGGSNLLFSCNNLSDHRGFRGSPSLQPSNEMFVFFRHLLFSWSVYARVV